MRRLLALLAGVALAVYAAVPPGARPLPAPPADVADPVRGVVHVHTRRSDGGGTVAQVARAASRAGLQFVILTDHGDGTRTPDPPAYHDGVLIVDAVEISTDGGHLLALGLPRAPYPLAGEARDVVEDVARLGGFAIAAHPASAKGELRWADWTVPVAGLEILNGDSEWRDESASSLARALLAYPVRPAETLAMLFDRGEDVFREWDALNRRRRVVAIAGADAHARLGLRGEEPYRGRFALPLPGYESMFRAMTVALPQARLSGDPAADADAVVEEIRAGRVYSSIDALGRRPAFAFTAESGTARAAGGEVLPIEGPVRLRAVVQAPSGVEIAILRDGVPIRTGDAPEVHHEGPAAPAVYRVEVRMPDAPGTPPVPWIVSNPIHVGAAIDEISTERPRPAAKESVVVYRDGPAPHWAVEHSTSSQGAVDVVNAVSGTQLLLRYAVSGAASSHPFVAVAVPAGPEVAAYDRLTFTARGSRPMRLSVQLRAPGHDADGERWHRSVFVDLVPREITVFFDDMRPRSTTSQPRPPLEEVQSLLFVIDTINTPAGTAGQLSLDDVRYER